MKKDIMLGLEGLTVLIASAERFFRDHIIREFQGHGCSVVTHDLQPPELRKSDVATPWDVTHRHEEYTRTSIGSSVQKLGGVINILVVIADSQQDDEDSGGKAIWDTSVDEWEGGTYRTNTRGVFLTIKHFLRVAHDARASNLRREGSNLAVVLVGRTIDRPLSSLIHKTNADIQTLDSSARVNAIALQSPTVGGKDPELKNSKKVSPIEISRLTALLASHRACGHLSGEILSLDAVWDRVLSSGVSDPVPRSLPISAKPRVKVVLTIDFDAVSGWLGTGAHSDNVLADYSAGFFAAKVGVPRLLKLFKKLSIADRCTWFIPGHSAESFKEVEQIIESGCEIGLHGYAHEGAYQLTPQQERDVLEKCIEISTRLTGKKPAGYRAPLYQVRESTLDLLEEYGFLYDASLTDHDCHPFFIPRRPPIKKIDFSKPASSWMHPIVESDERRPLVEIPCNWYMEDMTPMQFLPHVPNSHGYVEVRAIEQMWKDRFLWIWNHEEEAIFPLVIHPDTSGMAHVIGMIERMIEWLQSWGPYVQFCQAQEVARAFRSKQLDCEEP
ncbi:hypothetical protein VTO42DRAFT_4130 [Malbranchea cinnamomea]